MDKTYTDSRRKGWQSGSSTEGSLTSSPVNRKQIQRECLFRKQQNLQRIKHGGRYWWKFETCIWKTGKTGLTRISNQQDPKKMEMVKTQVNNLTAVGKVRASEG